ncbi:MAG: T9SS type A sorting domain-containing protein [Flavobacteriales bacterium]|nr:T9SS type A sorting domain-containing protein [Flavobacteriales bacterium]
MDYLFLHNLYELVYSFNYRNGNNLDVFHDTQDEVWDSPINGYNSVTTDQNFPETSTDVVLRGGKQVKLLSGFSVTAANNVHIYFEPFECTGTDTDPQYKSLLNTSNLESEMERFYKEFDKENVLYEEHLAKLEAESVEQDIANVLVVYPNPSNGQFIVKIDHDLNRIETLQIVDNVGRVVYAESNPQYSNQINLGEVASGIYHVRVISGTQVFEGETIVIE